MSNEQYTEGPYRVGLPGGPAGPFYSLVSSDGHVVAMQIPKRADAQLLAASPALVEACQDARAIIDFLKWKRNGDLAERQTVHRRIAMEVFDNLGEALVLARKGEGIAALELVEDGDD